MIYILSFQFKPAEREYMYLKKVVEFNAKSVTKVKAEEHSGLI